MAIAIDAPVIGLVPIGKFVFSHEDALRYKERICALLGEQGIRYVTIDDVIPDGMVRDYAHVGPVVEYLRLQPIDGLFLPHCNFGTEGAAGMIAKQLNLPTLLWGPRDEAPLPDGTRLRDTLCGLFASSKVLHKLGVPFTYIENCRVDDAALREGLEQFVRTCAVARTVRRGMRIGHIGQRIDFFWTTITNESELLERFNVEVLPLDMVTFIRQVRQRVQDAPQRYADEVASLRAQFTCIGSEDTHLAHILAVRDQMLALAHEHGLDGLAMQDFDSLVDEMGTYCFLANSMVSEVLPVACESDIHGAVSAILLRQAELCQQPVFLSDITIRHPEDENGVLLWHAGAPLAMRQPEQPASVGYHWILPSPVSGMPHFPLAHGPITVARFDGDRGEYRLAVGEGESMDGPHTQNNYVWMKVAHWPRWERRLIEGPFIHHIAMCYGHSGPALLEACKYIPGLQAVPLDH